MSQKNKAKPYDKRRGWLKNNNPPGDFQKAPRCRARTRKGTPCQAPAMKNGRCRLHGGKSTGPKTSEGIERIRAAHLKHGEYSRESVIERKAFNAFLRKLQETMKEIEDEAERIKIEM